VVAALSVATAHSLILTVSHDLFSRQSLGLYRFLGIAVLLDVRDIPQVGPLHRGADQPTLRFSCEPFPAAKPRQLSSIARITGLRPSFEFLVLFRESREGPLNGAETEPSDKHFYDSLAKEEANWVRYWIPAAVEQKSDGEGVVATRPYAGLGPNHSSQLAR
jgi:hypothetical protein